MASSSKVKTVSCKLTSPELQKRKAEVIVLLKENILNRKELSNGYQYTFKGSDTILDAVVTFIKTERQCCNFFTFKLSVEDEQSNITLRIIGPNGTKKFTNTEMEL